MAARARRSLTRHEHVAPIEHLRARSFDSTAVALAPAAYLVPAVILVITLVMRANINALRAVIWLLVAGATGLMVFAAVTSYRRMVELALAKGDDAPQPRRRDEIRLMVAVAMTGLSFGLAPWVPGGNGAKSSELILLFVLFPSTASAIATQVTVGRRDMFLAMVVPLTATSAVGLISSGDARFVGLAVVAVVYGLSLVMLHHVISQAPLQAIDLQWRSDLMLRSQSDDQARLTAAYQQLAESNERLAHQATHDPLTGLVNRRGTIDQLDQMLSLANGVQPVSVLFCDLDRFKAVNDALGHRGGDTFIRALADRLSRAIDRGSLVGRIGGDEFVIVLPDVDAENAARVAWRLIGVLAQPVHAEGRDVPSSGSIGVATSPQHGTTSSEILRSANAALYRAKHAGRNRVEVFDGTMQQALVDQVESEQALRRAIDNGEILPFFQPEIDATTGSVVGAELLARWVHRDGTVLNAVDWIGLASSTGLLDRVTEKVVGGARAQMRRLALLGLPDGFRFRINVAPSAADRTWRDAKLDQLLDGLDPERLTIDVRETGVSADLPAAAAAMASFRARGGRVCLDDFARGVSSLSLLRRLPLDEVRIDRLSVDTLTAHPHDRAIVRTIIALVRELGLSVTADGVETGPQADALIALGCVQQQGHLYAPALTGDAFEEFLLRRMAESYQRAARPRPEWHTRELA